MKRLGRETEDRSSRAPAAEETINSEIGCRIRLRRTMIGLTQSELAQQCGISPQQIHKYENGTSNLTSIRLAALACALHVKVGWFFGEDEATGMLPSDFFDMLADHHNLEVLLASSRIRSRARKVRLVKVAQLFAEEERSARPKEVEPLTDPGALASGRASTSTSAR